MSSRRDPGGAPPRRVDICTILPSLKTLTINDQESTAVSRVGVDDTCVVRSNAHDSLSVSAQAQMILPSTLSLEDIGPSAGPLDGPLDGRVEKKRKPTKRNNATVNHEQMATDEGTILQSARAPYWLSRADESSLGLEWRSIGGTKPGDGEELTNTALASALQHKTEFTQEEWDKFDITAPVRSDHFIKSLDIKSLELYFQPSPYTFNTELTTSMAFEMNEEWLRWYPAASGLQWTNIGGNPPTNGVELKQTHTKLVDALSTYHEPFSVVKFNIDQWANFNVEGDGIAKGTTALRTDHFIKAGASYFQPVAIGIQGSDKLLHKVTSFIPHDSITPEYTVDNTGVYHKSPHFMREEWETKCPATFNEAIKPFLDWLNSDESELAELKKLQNQMAKLVESGSLSEDKKKKLAKLQDDIERLTAELTNLTKNKADLEKSMQNWTNEQPKQSEMTSFKDVVKRINHKKKLELPPGFLIYNKVLPSKSNIPMPDNTRDNKKMPKLSEQKILGPLWASWTEAYKNSRTKNELFKMVSDKSPRQCWLSYIGAVTSGSNNVNSAATAHRRLRALADMLMDPAAPDDQEAARAAHEAAPSMNNGELAELADMFTDPAAQAAPDDQEAAQAAHEAAQAAHDAAVLEAADEFLAMNDDASDDDAMHDD